MADITYAQLIEDQVCRAIRRVLGLRCTDVAPNMRFIEDLHCDSLSMVEIPNAVENLYDIEISDDEAEALATVADLLALVDRKLREAGR